MLEEQHSNPIRTLVTADIGMDNTNEHTNNTSNNVGSDIVNQNINYSDEKRVQAWEQYESIQEKGHDGQSFIVNKSVTVCEEVMSKETITTLTRAREPSSIGLELNDHEPMKKKAKHIKNEMLFGNNSKSKEYISSYNVNKSTTMSKESNEVNICMYCQNVQDECYEVKYRDMCLHACYDYYLSLPSNHMPNNNTLHKLYHSAYLSQVRYDLLKKTNLYETNCELSMPNCMLNGSYAKAFNLNNTNVNDMPTSLKRNRRNNVQLYLDAKEMFENSSFDDEFNKIS